MRASWLVLALLGSPAFAGDCPTPQPLSCERLIALSEQRHCLPTPQTETAVPCVAVPCATMPCSEVPCAPTEKVVTKTQTIEVPVPVPMPPTGKWFAGGGPIYQDGFGLQSVVGYKFPSGWLLMGGPNYIDRDANHGSVSNCAAVGGSGPGNTCSCVTLPWAASSPSPWGAVAILAHTF